MKFLKIILGVAVGVILAVILLMVGCSLLIGKAALNVQQAQQEAQLYVSNVNIQEGWTWDRERDWTYIKGRITNTGTKTIRYWKISARYLDGSGNVLDTDITNSGELLRPNESKSFQIMHKHDDAYKSVRLRVEEVSLQ